MNKHIDIDEDRLQPAGVVIGKIVDHWTWWQNALKGNIGPIHHEPEQGYFRVRGKGQPWEPVAIWFEESQGEWLAYRAGREVRADEIWTWACRNPITHEAYEKAMAGCGFDDEPKPAPAPVGHNSGETDPLEAIKIELAGEIEQVTEFSKKPVESQADADRLGIWAKRLTEIGKRADQLRVVEKEPHLIASREVDDKWRGPIADAKDWAAKAKKLVEPFLIAQRRAEEERQRKAIEAERQRRAEEEAALHAKIKAAQEAEAKDQKQIDDLIKEAEQRAQQPIKVDERKVNAGRTGARVSVRVEKVANVTDYAAAAAALVAMNHKDIIAVIDQLAARAAKAGMPFAGMEVREVEKVV